MYLKDFSVENYRNLSSFKLEFSKDFNILCGMNGQGKTNTVECIMLLLCGKSHRESVTANFVGHAGARTLAAASVKCGASESYGVRLEIENGKKTHFIDGEALKSRQTLLDTFCSVFFSPDDLRTVKDAPSFRRAFLNDAMTSVSAQFLPTLSEYARALKQRNVLLKTYSPSLKPVIEAYDETLSTTAAVIFKSRIKFLKDFEVYLNDNYLKISSEKEKLSVNYISNVLGEIDGADIKGGYKRLLSETLKEDAAAGFTTRGPHADDIAVFIDGRLAKKFASQGQTRSVALCMKLAQCAMLKDRKHVEPIVILDDVMSELDDKRRERLVEMLRGYQVFITCTAPDFDLKDAPKKIFYVKDGNVALRGENEKQL